MPYIPYKRRKAFEFEVGQLADRICNPGDFNYVITLLTHRVLEQVEVDYTTVSTVIGGLECAKAELIRKVLAPHEDKKRRQHGAISALDRDGAL